MPEVRTRDEAIASVDHALTTWLTTVGAVLAQARATVRAAQVEADRSERERRAQVAAIEALLNAADGHERRQLAVRLARAQEDLGTAQRSKARIAVVAQALHRLNRSYATSTVHEVEGARASLRSMSEALAGYRSSSVAFDGSPSSGGVAAAAIHPPSSGLMDVDVESAGFADNPILDDNPEDGSYGKGGLSRADYRWAVQTWNDIVGPGVARGKTRDDFARRDAESDAKPLRRTADVYDVFLGSDRIRVARQSDGSLDVINGRHRLQIAKELGIKNLPGQISQ